MEYVNKGKKIVESIYNNYDEDSRLTRTRHGQLEYITTMHYIEKYLKPNAKVLEVGAGTGKYSCELAKRGYNVTAVELVESNLKVLKKNAKGIKNIKAYQGDALNLSRFKDNSYDIVLVLGPMYHLYSNKDQHQAIDEALRVAKTGAVVMFAFLPIASMIFGWGMEGNIKQAFKENFGKDYKVLHKPSQGFTAYEIDGFKQLFKNKACESLHMVSADSIMDSMEDRKSFSMDDEDFKLFTDYHLATCEKTEMQGLSFHMLYICKKL